VRPLLWFMPRKTGRASEGIMFGIGFSEIVLVGVVVLLFVKPRDLPHLLRKMGDWYGRWRRVYYAVYDELRNLR